MDTVFYNSPLREVKHKVINGRQVMVHYREYHSENGNVMVRYSTQVDGNSFPLDLEISKDVLLAIQGKFGKDIYHIISESILDKIKTLTSTGSARSAVGWLPVKTA